jgi:hypothetical protein
MAAVPSIKDRIRKAATSKRRSKLFLWMFENFNDFAETVAEAGRPNWQELAKTFGEEGMTDLKGNQPTAEATRLTWFRVRAAMDTRNRKKAPTRPAYTPLAAPTERQPSPLAAEAPSNYRLDPPRERQKLQLRSPIPLEPGEPAPDDGSLLPRPLRPVPKV